MSSASRCSPSAVEPTRSQNKAVMTLRSSWTSVATSFLPHFPQKLDPPGFSVPQDGQVNIGRAYVWCPNRLKGHGLVTHVRHRWFAHPIPRE